MINRSSSMGHDDKSSFSTNVVDKKLDENVDSKSFVHVTDGFDEI